MQQQFVKAHNPQRRGGTEMLTSSPAMDRAQKARLKGKFCLCVNLNKADITQELQEIGPTLEKGT